MDWDFLRNILYQLGFHDGMIMWIMACITTVLFSINVKDNLHGFFKGARGLSQSDPLSPYLFTLVMEVLTLMLKRNVQESNSFRYHPKCNRIYLINLCFADDLVMFSYGNISSMSVLMKALGGV